MKKLWLLLLAATSLWGQETSENLPLILEFDPRWREARPHIEVAMYSGAASAGWSSLELYDFAYADFIDEDLKSDLIEGLGNRVRLGTESRYEVRWVFQRQQDRHALAFPKRSLRLRHRSLVGASVSQEALALVLRGNAPFAGQDLALGEVSFENWYYSELQFQSSFKIDTIPLSLGVAISAHHDLDDYRLQNGNLFTAANGSHLDLSGNYAVLEGNPGAAPVNGLGLAFSLASTERWGKHEVLVSAEDLGFAYLAQADYFAKDSAWRFEGVNVRNIFNVPESDVDGQADSLLATFGGERGSRFRLMPFQVKGEYRYHLQATGWTYLYGRAQYLRIPGYIPRVDLGVNWLSESKSQRVGLSLAYGGFTHFSAGVEYQWYISRHWRLDAQLSNAFGVVLPMWGGGTFGGLSLRYLW